MKTAVAKDSIADETEKFRQFVIASRDSAAVAAQAARSLEKLNELYQEDRTLFTEEDIRWLNVLRGYLGVRLAAHEPATEHVRKAKRKGDKLDHCWRCETPIDERFTENCPTCSEKAYQWRICPICSACGCQRAGTTLV